MPMLRDLAMIVFKQPISQSAAMLSNRFHLLDVLWLNKEKDYSQKVTFQKGKCKN